MSIIEVGGITWSSTLATRCDTKALIASALVRLLANSKKRIIARQFKYQTGLIIGSVSKHRKQVVLIAST